MQNDTRDEINFDDDYNSNNSCLKKTIEKSSLYSHVLINFGKHKGKTYEEMFKSDPNYCLWLKSGNCKSASLREYLKSALKNFSEDDYFLSFGKYKGKALSEINSKDPAYIKWLKNNEIVNSKCIQLSKKLEKY